MALQYPAYPLIPSPGPSPLASLAESFGQGFTQARDMRLEREGLATADAIRQRNEAFQRSNPGGLSALGGIFGAMGGGAAPASAAPHTAATPGGSRTPALATKGEVYEPFMAAVRTGITNPYGLAAVAATGNAESSFSPGNAFRQWSDPSESGAPGQAGGVLSWRAERLQNMRNFARARGDDPSRPSPETQGMFFLNEDPQLVARLNSAQSAEEAIGLMNNAWRFAGYDRPGGEAARRTNMARVYAGRFRSEAPVEVASLDPSAGMSSALAYTDGGSPRPSSTPTVVPNAASSTGRGGNGTAGPAMPPALLESGAPGQAAAAPSPVQMAQAQPPIGGNIGAIIQGIASGTAAPPPVSSAEWIALARSPVTRPLAEQIFKASRGDPDAPERLFRTAMDLEGLLYDRQQDAYERDRDALGAIPAGYRRSADGQGLEFIPGGPQDPSQNANGETYFGNPIPVQNPDGSVSYGQIGNRGSFRPIELGEGQSFAPPTKTIDTGTETILMDQAGNVISRTPKDNFGERYDQALGTGAGETDIARFTDAPGAWRQASQMLDSIDGILDHSALGLATGAAGGFLSSIPMTPMRDVRNRIEQLGGQAFLQAFESLKGGGAITEVEGLKATQAIARLDTAQSEEDFRTALNDLRSVVEGAMRRAEQQMQSPPRTSNGSAVIPPASAGPQTNDPLGIR